MVSPSENLSVVKGRVLAFRVEVKVVVEVTVEVPVDPAPDTVTVDPEPDTVTVVVFPPVDVAAYATPRPNRKTTTMAATVTIVLTPLLAFNTIVTTRHTIKFIRRNQEKPARQGGCDMREVTLVRSAI